MNDNQAKMKLQPVTFESAPSNRQFFKDFSTGNSWNPQLDFKSSFDTSNLSIKKIYKYMHT